MGTPSRTWTNPKSVSYTPSGGSAILLKRVTAITISGGVQMLTFSGDGDRYMTIQTPIMLDPSVSITSADIVTIMSMMGGLAGVLTWVMEDGKNQDGSGNVTWTLNNAVPHEPTGGANHAAISSGSISFACFSSDGTTNPLSYSVAA